jgi:hypothetical protein
MTRRKWTTEEQEAWLDLRKAAFLEANQKKNAGKEFFPIVTKEFREKWPVPPVTEQEINDAGSAELAMRAKQGKYDKVCTQHLVTFPRKEGLTDIYSERVVGFTTTRGL